MPDEHFLDKKHDIKVVSSLDYVQYLETYVEEVPPLYTGMEMLDEKMGGAVPGEVWLLSGIPKHGKSTFMRTLIYEYYTRGVLSMVFSFEETPTQFFRKFPNNSKDLVFFVPRIRKAYDIEDMFERAKEAKDRYGVRVMFIDSGQKLVHDVQRNASLAHVIGDFVSRLVVFAEQEELIVWLIWHLTKDNEGVPLTALGPGLLRDSGRLWQETHGLIFVYRSVKDDGIVRIQENFLKISAARRSEAFEEIVPIVKVGPYFRELE
jgi:predicted ATP-dependent serine protease